MGAGEMEAGVMDVRVKAEREQLGSEDGSWRCFETELEVSLERPG